jgi:hypothetical protein
VSLIVEFGVAQGGTAVDQVGKRPAWRRGCGNGACVEVAKVGDRYLIRDSNRPNAAVLSFSESDWDAFVCAVKRDEFRFD